MEAASIAPGADLAPALDEEFRALERALESKRCGDISRPVWQRCGEDVTLELQDGRLVRGRLRECDGALVSLEEGRSLPLHSVRAIVHHVKTSLM